MLITGSRRFWPTRQHLFAVKTNECVSSQGGLWTGDRIRNDTPQADDNNADPETGRAKGDPIATAEVAAVLAARNTSQALPFCHPTSITNVQTEAKIGSTSIAVQLTVRTTASAGVEMEALNGASAHLLSLWDMVKQCE